MARDPDTFRVSPALTNLPMVVAPPVQDAGPQQLVEAGQAITRAGGVAANLYEDALKEQNEVRVTEALTKLTERRNEMTYGEAGWASQRGKNALERPDGKTLDEEYGSEFDSTISNLETGLGNDAQRRMFRENAQRMSLELRGRMQAHATQQGTEYKLEVDAGVVDTGSRQVALATTPEEIAEGMALIERGANGIFSTKGTPEGDARDQIMRGLKTPGLIAQLAKMSDAGDVDGAEAFLNEYGSSLTAEAYTRVSGALVEQRAIVDGENWGEQVWGTGAAQNALAEPQNVIPPVVGNFTPSSKFGPRGGRNHDGIDYPMPLNTPVRAGADGTVRVKRDPKGYGLYVDVVLDDGTILRNAHLNAAEVEDGARVSQGQVIARSGNSGRSTGPHLHYEVRPGGGSPVNPAEWHEGRPKTQGKGVVRSLSDMLQEIDEDDTRTAKKKQYAKQLVKERWSARDADERRNQEQAVNTAYAEIDRNGSLSNATRAALIGTGQASSLSALRSFEKATQDRRSGKVVSDVDGLEGYGKTLIAIADGEVPSFDELLRVKPYVSDSQFKQLADAYAKSPRSAQGKASGIISEMKPILAGNPAFVDDDGKFDKAKYHRFTGSVVSTIEGRELNTGKPVTKEERREIVLGLLAVDTVNGEKSRNFEIRQLYDAIPPRARLNSVRALQKRGVKNPSISDVVSVWDTLTESQRKAYRGQ